MGTSKTEHNVTKHLYQCIAAHYSPVKWPTLTAQVKISIQNAIFPNSCDLLGGYILGKWKYIHTESAYEANSQRFSANSLQLISIFSAFDAQSSEKEKVSRQWALCFFNPKSLRVAENGFGRSKPVKL